jgi:hypothetical protein
MGTLKFILLYLDPGTGSLIIQLLIAGVTAVLFFFRNVREKIFGFIKNLRKKNENVG